MPSNNQYLVRNSLALIRNRRNYDVNYYISQVVMSFVGGFVKWSRVDAVRREYSLGCSDSFADAQYISHDSW